MCSAQCCEHKTHHHFVCNLHPRQFHYGQKWNIKYRNVNSAHKCHDEMEFLAQLLSKWYRTIMRTANSSANRLHIEMVADAAMDRTWQLQYKTQIRNRIFHLSNTLYHFEILFDYYLRILSHLQLVFPHILLFFVQNDRVHLLFQCISVALVQLDTLAF